jgi:hypothetical protein
LTVELEANAEPIAGRIKESGGTAHEFSGYMSLISTLERLRRTPDVRTQSPTEEEGLSRAS